MTDESKSAKWVVNLKSGEWGTVKYGVVEYLRRHPKMRAATSVTGLLWVAGWLATSMGYKWHLLLLPAISTIFMTPTLLWFAVVSGPDFQLGFAEAKTPDSSVNPAIPVKSVLDPEGYGIEALDKSYVWTERYARSSFRWAMFSLIAGITVACGNGWLITSGSRISSQYHSSIFIWIFAATFFVLSVIFLVRSMFLFRRAAIIHDRLLDLQRTLTAIKYLERSQNQSPGIDPSMVIAKLLSPSQNPTDPE